MPMFLYCFCNLFCIPSVRLLFIIFVLCNSYGYVDFNTQEDAAAVSSLFMNESIVGFTTDNFICAFAHEILFCNAKNLRYCFRRSSVLLVRSLWRRQSL